MTIFRQGHWFVLVGTLQLALDWPLLVALSASGLAAPQSAATEPPWLAGRTSGLSRRGPDRGATDDGSTGAAD